MNNDLKILYAILSKQLKTSADEMLVVNDVVEISKAIALLSIAIDFDALVNRDDGTGDVSVLVKIGNMVRVSTRRVI